MIKDDLQSNHYINTKTDAHSSPLSGERQLQNGYYYASSSGVKQELSRPKVTDEELEQQEDDRTGEEEQPEAHKAPPLPLEHIYIHDDANPLRLTDFEVLETLGTGTFGRVLLVRLRATSPHAQPGVQQHFAMKVLRKTEVVRLRQAAHVQAERHILSRIQHPFIVDLYATFKDPFNVYMLLSYVPGGELFSHLRRAGRFTPDVTRFYLAGIVLALRYLHSYNVIYRDLKPENLLLDHRGYLRIADFGFSKIVDDRTWTLCGTPEYLAPEIIQSSGHGKAVDWWACGILTYEMLVGYPPFFDDNPFGIYEKILRGKVHYPKELDSRSRELIRGFLNPDRSKRLGNLRGGAEDILTHDWFRGVDWGALERGEIRAPLIPHVTSSCDVRNFTKLPLPDPADLPGMIPSMASRLHELRDDTGDIFANF
ncbi:serine/threonine protein kinase, AGC [Tulasnella sp. JGI-2019a]|nr:serine/threonine protein kinase, AGC [Tulasnella sp. JGI-2019a]